jgi:hypothetical protein
MMVSRLNGFVVACVVCGCVVFGGLADAGSAMATMPWWHVNTISAPASVPGAESRLVLEVSNLGDAPANGFVSPITITDQLPAGVVPEHVYGEGGGSFGVGIDGVKEIIHCTIPTGSQTVECTYAGPLLSYERFMIAISVQVEPEAGTGVSDVSVSGGGAPSIVSRHALALGESIPVFGTETYEVTPEEEGGSVDTQAGSHPFQMTGTLTLNTKTALVDENGSLLPEVQPVALAKDERIVLPPGLVGNPSSLPKCSLSVFVKPTTSHCPDDTAIGVATPISTNLYTNTKVPFAQAVALYNLEPAEGEPARFGFTTQVGPVVLDTSVLTGGDYSVVVNVPDIPDDLGIIGSQVTFWGVPGDSRHDTSRGSCLDELEGDVHKVTKLEFACPVQEKPQPFLIMPTSCNGPLRTSVEGESWEQADNEPPGRFTAPTEYAFSNSMGVPISQDGCNRLNFEPSLSVAPDGEDASTPSGLSVHIHVDQEAGLDPTGEAESTVKNTTVTLPAGVALNPAGADGLSACDTSEIALQSPNEQECPESSKIATVELKSPLLPNPLVGSAYLATQDANPFGSLIAVYIVVYDPVSGVRVKLAGEVKPNPETGQLVSTFKETPPLPFEDLTVHFFGGSRAPLGTPALCGTYTTTASIEPWSGNRAAEIASHFNIGLGPNGIPCANPLPFQPSLTTGSLNLQAGAFTPFTMTMSREDGNQNLEGIALSLPPGLLGSLSNVKLCGEAQANAGLCGPESLIGHTTVSVGLGGNPYTVSGGEVFITGPYGNAPYGLSIKNPAKAGPFDLENNTPCDCVVVRAKVEVNPITAALTITSDTKGPYAIPQFIDGIPLQIKHVNVTVDRPNFTFNPTNCSPMNVGATLTSTQGATAALNVPFQVTNCATLGFKPKLTVSTTAKKSRADGTSLHVKLVYPKATFGTQANIKSVKVDLPKQLPSELKTLQQACPDTTFNQNPAACSPNSRVGEAKATTPLLPVTLNGPAYFVSHGGAKFPELVIILSGYGTTVQLHSETFINEKTDITSSTFRAIPDVPVGTFELSLPQQKYSALAAPTNLCNAKQLKMPTMFTAQNGTTIKQNTPITVTGCPKHKTVKHKSKKRK